MLITLLLRLNSAELVILVILITSTTCTHITITTLAISIPVVHHAVITIVVLGVFLIILESHLLIYIIIRHVSISRTIK